MRETWLWGLIIAGFVSMPALAQDLPTATEKILACKELADSVERLSCFDRAAAELSAAVALPSAQARAPVPVRPGSPSAAESELIQKAAVAPAGTSMAATAPAQQANANTPKESEPSGSVLPSWIPRVTFGERRDVEREPDQFETTLTRIERNNLGRHFFTTAEGHVWKQKRLDKIKAPSTLPTDIVLDRNIMGGIRIKILETKEVHSVTRVE